MLTNTYTCATQTTMKVYKITITLEKFPLASKPQCHRCQQLLLWYFRALIYSACCRTSCTLNDTVCALFCQAYFTQHKCFDIFHIVSCFWVIFHFMNIPFCLFSYWWMSVLVPVFGLSDFFIFCFFLSISLYLTKHYILHMSFFALFFTRTWWDIRYNGRYREKRTGKLGAERRVGYPQLCMASPRQNAWKLHMKSSTS